jgi:hypothetical protein
MYAMNLTLCINYPASRIVRHAGSSDRVRHVSHGIRKHCPVTYPLLKNCEFESHAGELLKHKLCYSSHRSRFLF